MEAVLLKGWSSGVQKQEALCVVVVSPGFMLVRVGGMWLCCGLKGHPTESCLFLSNLEFLW